MAVTKRSRTDVQTEKAIEAFAAMAEKPLTAVPPLNDLSDAIESPAAMETELSPEPAPTASPVVKAAQKEPARNSAAKVKAALAPAMAEWKVRNREPKVGGINFRASASQLDLLRNAALIEEISQQKVLERLVWPILEEKYGSGSSD
ncbi:hypothetical protein ACFC25_09765 [Pseudarthrobacter sp. NPDC055928]|uniref:hypothetical protein n=1 Tax=Pseudarthrobacter sp. NPDC055928 TaxID=3345661 RepID=UPI0035E04160